MGMLLHLLPQDLAVVRREPSDPIPEWIQGSTFCSITITPGEQSIFCDTKVIPEDIKKASGWRAFQVAGQIDFELSGIIAQLAVPLSSKQISIFSISTHDTDYMLVEQAQLDDALDVLRRAGHTIKLP
jgi:hypothetical protein